MEILNTFESQARVRLNAQKLNRYLVGWNQGTKWVNGISEDSFELSNCMSPWWDIHPVEYGNSSSGYKLSCEGYFISKENVNVSGSGTAAGLTTNENKAMIMFVVGDSQDLSKYVLVDDISKNPPNALSYYTNGSNGIFREFVGGNSSPLYQYFTIENQLQPKPKYEIGDKANGGIVFYTYQNKDKGLVAALEDQSTKINWGDAVSLCTELTLNDYDDWHLPSLDELTLMYTNLYKHSLGNFARDHYWSSEELDGDYTEYAWLFEFNSDGFTYADLKKIGYYARAIRAF